MVAVRDGVLIPRPETEAVVDMVATTDCERGFWSSPSSSSAAASRLGAIAVPYVDVSISFTDHRLHGTHAHMSEIHSQQFGVRANY